MRDRRDVAVAGDLCEQIAPRRLPPVDLAAAERCLGRERIQRDPFDAVEMHRLRTGGEAEGARRSAGVARPVFLEPRKGSAGAADMLVGEETIRAAADDLLDRLVG